MQPISGKPRFNSGIRNLTACTQLIAIRYNDARNGTNIIEGVLEKYTAAWKSRQGFLQDDGLFIQMFKVKRGDRILERGVGFTAW